jgi:hypothetical protein
VRTRASGASPRDSAGSDTTFSAIADTRAAGGPLSSHETKRPFSKPPASSAGPSSRSDSSSANARSSAVQPLPVAPVT